MNHSSDSIRLSVVIPVYCEERSITRFLERLLPVLRSVGTYEAIFVLDPSPDRTEELLREAALRDPGVGLIVMSRRFGQPAATMAGILNARGQWVAAIDADLQDPPELIAEMLTKAEAERFDVVTARRRSRKGEPYIKTLAAHLGYFLINRLSEVPIPTDTGDFRLMSRRVVEELRGLSEGHGFLRGLVSLVGFRQGEIEYERAARMEGSGHYNRYLGSLKIGLNGLFGFSTAPLRAMMWTGFGIAVLSVIGICVVVALKLATGNRYPLGIPTITVLVLFVGGVQLAAVGVLGEYIGRIYDEVRRRPPYIVDRALNVVIRDPRGPRSGGTSNTEHLRNSGG